MSVQFGLKDVRVEIHKASYFCQSKSDALSVQLSGDALACCWRGGRVDWRDAGSGRVLRRAQLRSAAAAMLNADYRAVGAPDLVCVSDRGEGKVYPTLGLREMVKIIITLYWALTQSRDYGKHKFIKIFMTSNRRLKRSFQRYDFSCTTKLCNRYKYSICFKTVNYLIEIFIF